MYQRLILNDLKNNKFTAIATCVFMSVNAALLGLSVLLFVSLSGSIDNLMNVAKTPDFLQMHTRVIDENALSDFANQRSEIDKMQICRFLNIPNSQIRIGGKCQSILYILDGQIKGELNLGKYQLNKEKEREQQVAEWLSSLGW